MTTLQALNRSPTKNLSSLRDYFVSEAEYWEKYYNGPNVVYECFVLPAYAKANQRAQQSDKRAQLERQRAERLAARLRSLGVDPDQIH